MVFERTIQGVEIMLRIDGYRSSESRGKDAAWCDCGYSFRFKDIICYRMDHDELFLAEEIDHLHDVLTGLLEGRIQKPREEILIEPDFSFLLFPQNKAETSARSIHTHPAQIMWDVRAEWRIHLWNEGLTDNYLTITMDRGDIAAFRDFLADCIHEPQQQA